MDHDPADDLVLTASRIYPSAHTDPVEALLLRAGAVVAAGARDEVRAAASSRARHLDLASATVTPGFTDSHIHLTSWALARRRVSLLESDSVGEVAARLRAGTVEGNGWIVGHGWSRGRLGELPSAGDLDLHFPDRPVWLDSQDLHAAWLNSAALRACGIDRNTPDPTGGRIERDARGAPTGVLFENARAIAMERVQPPSSSEVATALDEAQGAAHRMGITGVHSVEVTGLADFRGLAARGNLRLRVLQHVQLAGLDEAIDAGLRSGDGDRWIRIGGVKMFLDGALGSRTAWLRDPYQGSTSDYGIRTLAAADFEAAVHRAAANGLASTVHAIGDAAVEEALGVLSTIPSPPALPHRIEHLQLCPPEFWSRSGGSGIVASMQPVHLLTDREVAERYWGSGRSRGAYPFAALAGAGMVMAFGSDAPVETPDPRPAIYAATQRGTWAGYETGEPAESWFPEHALSSSEVVAAYTEGPAFAAGLSQTRGRLLPGFDADLVAWSLDPLAADGRDSRKMECLFTMVDGVVVHET